MNRWRFKLDTNLPGELGQIADWINTAEAALARGISFDPLKLSPEENVHRFSQLNEEHAVNLFSSLKKRINSHVFFRQFLLIKKLFYLHFNVLNVINPLLINKFHLNT